MCRAVFAEFVIRKRGREKPVPYFFRYSSSKKLRSLAEPILLLFNSRVRNYRGLVGHGKGDWQLQPTSQNLPVTRASCRNAQPINSCNNH